MRYGSIGLYLLLLNWPLKPQLLDKSGEIFWNIKSHIIWLFNHARKRLFIHFFNRQRVVGGICTPHVYMTVININSLDGTVYLIYPVNIDIISVSYYDVQKHHSGLCATTWSQEWRNARHRSEITRRHSRACGRRGAELITTATSSRAGLQHDQPPLKAEGWPLLHTMYRTALFPFTFTTHLDWQVQLTACSTCDSYRWRWNRIMFSLVHTVQYVLRRLSTASTGQELGYLRVQSCRTMFYLWSNS